MLHLYLGNHRHLPFEIPQNKTGFSENKQIQDAALPVFKLCGSRFSCVYPHRACTGAGHPCFLICHAGLVYHADRDLQAEETEVTGSVEECESPAESSAGFLYGSSCKIRKITACIAYNFNGQPLRQKGENR